MTIQEENYHSFLTVEDDPLLYEDANEMMKYITPALSRPPARRPYCSKRPCWIPTCRRSPSWSTGGFISIEGKREK
jgi:hypothetical protein